MTHKSRIIHTLLFEAVALVLLVILGLAVSESSVESMTGLAIVLSLLAMSWNYFYNILFDRLYGENRIERSLWLRIGHGLGFEGGLVVVSLPLMMWWLDVNFWTALLLDIGAVIFFVIYAIVFNWIYDIVVAKYFTATPTVCE